MKTTLVMGSTINGYITGPNDDTDWLKDFDSFYKTVADFGVAVMGKRTCLECIKYNIFPYKNALNIVMTHDKELLAKVQDQVLYTDKTPKEIISLAKNKGFKRLLVIGGGHINGSFLKAGLLDELVLHIHPVLVDKGIRLFEGNFPYQNMEFVDFKQFGNQFLQIRYKFKK